MTLISHAGVVEPVADHNVSSCQRGPNDFLQVLCAGGIEQRELGHWPQLAAVAKQDLPNLFTEARTAGFSGGRHLVPAASQVFDKQAMLRALARAVDAFQRDEKAWSVQGDRPLSVVRGQSSAVWVATRPYLIVRLRGVERLNFFRDEPPNCGQRTTDDGQQTSFDSRQHRARSGTNCHLVPTMRPAA